MDYDQGVGGKAKGAQTPGTERAPSLRRINGQLRDRAATEETNQAETRTHQCEGCRFRGRNVADASLD